MIDRETLEQLAVSTDGDAGPYLMVPLEQLPEVRTLLQGHAIPHVVDEDAIQLDGKAVIAVINFGRAADPAQIQKLLDEAA
jgi:DhnA family fructose-bisphosphate aldolase class Ia